MIVARVNLPGRFLFGFLFLLGFILLLLVPLSSFFIALFAKFMTYSDILSNFRHSILHVSAFMSYTFYILSLLCYIFPMQPWKCVVLYVIDNLYLKSISDILSVQVSLRGVVANVLDCIIIESSNSSCAIIYNFGPIPLGQEWSS